MCRGNWNGARRVSLVHFFVPILGYKRMDHRPRKGAENGVVRA